MGSAELLLDMACSEKKKDLLRTTPLESRTEKGVKSFDKVLIENNFNSSEGDVNISKETFS